MAGVRRSAVVILATIFATGLPLSQSFAFAPVSSSRSVIHSQNNGRKLTRVQFQSSTRESCEVCARPFGLGTVVRSGVCSFSAQYTCFLRELCGAFHGSCVEADLLYLSCHWFMRLLVTLPLGKNAIWDTCVETATVRRVCVDSMFRAVEADSMWLHFCSGSALGQCLTSQFDAA